MPRALLLERVSLDWQAQLQALDAVALHTKAALLLAEEAAAIKQAGYGLFCYTVNDAVQAKALLAMGVDAFCTDCIDEIGADFCVANSEA